MVQQTSVQKDNNRAGFFKRIFTDSAAKGEEKREIVFLLEDYMTANKIASNLSSHSKWIPYPFLVDHVKKISDEMRGQAEIFRQKIIELGGQVSQINLESREVSRRDNSGEGLRQNIKSLVMDMEEHSTACDALMRQRNMLADSGVVNLLSAVILDMQRQKDELTDIVMRIS